MAGELQSYGGHINETTFLLCKPDAAQSHRQILQMVSEAGFQVQAKSFRITRAVALELVSMFPCVQYKHQAAVGGISARGTRSGSGMLSPSARIEATQGSGASDDEDTSRAPLPWAWTRKKAALHYGEQYDEDAADAGVYLRSSGAEMRGNTDHRTNRGSAKMKGSVGRQDRSGGGAPSGPHAMVFADIMRLTSRHRDTDAGVNAGFSPAEADSSNVLFGSTSLGTGTAQQAGRNELAASADAARRSFGGGAANSQQQQQQRQQHRVASTAIIKSKQLEAMAYEELVKEHVAHLTGGGTCLAVILSAPNAVEKLLELVGPEVPSDARRVAPNSIRATLGVDVVRNAVHAATNLTEANACIAAVFGYEPQCTSAAAADNASAQGRLGSGGRFDCRSESSLVNSASGAGRRAGGEGLPPIVMRPALEMLRLQQPTGSHITLASILPAPSACPPETLLSHYTGVPPSTAWSRDAVSGGVRRVDSNMGPSTADPHQRANPLRMQSTPQSESAEETLARAQREVEEERRRLVSAGRVLHLREMDLLRREEALRDATLRVAETTNAVASSTKTGLDSYEKERKLGLPSKKRGDLSIRIEFSTSNAGGTSPAPVSIISAVTETESNAYVPAAP